MTEERINPNVLMAQLLNSVQNLLKDTVPIGEVACDSIYLSGQQQQRYTPETPWFNISITNRGPNSAYIAINRDNADEHEIENLDVYSVNMGAAKIKTIYLRTLAGGTATVDLTGVY